MSRCNYETAPYSGSGIDPPTCGAPAVLTLERESFCVQHARWVLRAARDAVVVARAELERVEARVRALEVIPL